MSEWPKAFDRTPLEPEKPWSPPGSRAVGPPPLLDLSELTGDAQGRYATSGAQRGATTALGPGGLQGFSGSSGVISNAFGHSLRHFI